MKKRLLSLCLTAALCLTLLPTAAWAEEADPVDSTSAVEDVADDSAEREGITALAANNQVTDIWFDAVEPSTGGIAQGNQKWTADSLESTTGNMTWGKDTNYVVGKNQEVTIDGDLTIDGTSIRLILFDGAKLTITGSLILKQSGLSIWSHTESLKPKDIGQIIIKNSHPSGAAIRSDCNATLSFYGGKLTAKRSEFGTVSGVYLVNGIEVMTATLGGEALSPADLWKKTVTLSDNKDLVIEWCSHSNTQCTSVSDTQHQERCLDCNFKYPKADCVFNTPAYESFDAESHYLKCSDCGTVSSTAKEVHRLVTATTDDGRGHTTRCIYCGYTSGDPKQHTYDTTGKCTECGFKPVAQDNAGNLYDSLQIAFQTVSDGGTITLTSDIISRENITFGEYLNDDGDWVKPGYSVTLVMNGHTLCGSTSAPALIVADGSLTIADKATVTAQENSGEPAIEVTGGKLTFEGDVAAIGDLREKDTDGGMERSPAINATGGELDFQGTQESQVALDLLGGLTLTGDAKLTHLLTNGKFYMKPAGSGDSVYGKTVSVENSNNYNYVPDLLADNHIFVYLDPASSNDRYVTRRSTFLDIDVAIEEHTHNFVADDGYKCVCGLTANVAVTLEAGGATYYYTDLSAALAKVSTDGGTVKLLNNVTAPDPLSIVNAKDLDITLDLNGHTLSGPGDSSTSNTFLQVLTYGNVTICDSSDTKTGKIESTNSGSVCVSSGTLTITGGTFTCPVTIRGGNMKISGGNFAALETRNNTAIRTLLADGYGLKRSDGRWLTEDELTRTTAAEVTAEVAPLTSVAISVTPGTTVEYGQSVTLNLEYKTNPTDISVDHKWYSVDENDQATEIPDANGTEYTPTNLSVGEHKYRVTATADGYSKSADITITVEKIDLANATVTIDPWHADGKFRFYPYASETAALSSLSVVTVTANGKKDRLSDSDFTYTGATATRVGKYTLTITAKDSCANYKGSKTFDWEVIPHQLYRPVFQGSQTYTKTYDGTTTLPGSYTWLADFYGKEGTDQNVTLKSGDYEVTAAEFVSADAGENKPINQTITLKNENFVFSPTEIIKIPGITTTDKTLTYKNFTPTEAYPTGGTTFNIEKATMPDFDKEVTLDIVNNHADTYTVDLSALLPKLESPRTYGDTQYEVDQSSVEELTQGYNAIQNVGFAVNPDNGKTQLTFHAPAVENQTEGSVGAIKITVTPTNYKPVTLTVNLRAVNKQRLGMFVSVATDPIVYGMTLGDIKLSADATVDNQVIPGTIAWEDPLTTVPAAGQATYRWTFTPDDTMHYLTASNTITFSVDKATPTGAPTYTAITAGGKTLADAALTANAGWPSGTVQWVDKDGKPLPASTQVQANTEYTWSFTPADAANYNGATGSVTLYAVTSGGGGGGGGSSSSSKPSTTTRPDGTKVQTETKADGTKIQTETKKDGSTVKTTTNPNGSSVTETKAADGSTGTVKTDKNGQTTAETALSNKAIEDAKKNGEAVKAPVEVEATRDSSTAPTVKIELPRNSGDTKVEIPVTNVKPGTVAVLVHPDGTEEIVKNSLPTEDGIQLTVDGNATVKIVDNSKGFIDTQDHWAKDAIDFVSARGLVNGMSGTTYAPDASTTRAQLWTILARQSGADLTGGASWYEKAQAWAKDKGVSDGADPNGAITRTQMVTMLYRAAGSPEVSITTTFTDVPADSYYAKAVAWAVENGITAGVGGGRFDPNSTCTRGQIATFLWRAMAE